MKQAYRILQSRTHFRGDLFTVQTASVAYPDGTRVVREIVERKPSVGIVAIDQKGLVSLVEEFQAGIGRIVLGLPGGKVDGSERPLAAAKRELREEIGYAARQWETLFHWDGAGSWKWPRTYFLARKLVRQPLPQDSEERIIIRKLTLRRAIRLALDGRLDTSDTGLALVRAYERIMRKRIV